MKRILFTLALGLLLINLTSGCNQSSDSTAAGATNAPAATNATTNTPPTH